MEKTWVIEIKYTEGFFKRWCETYNTILGIAVKDGTGFNYQSIPSGIQ